MSKVSGSGSGQDVPANSTAIPSSSASPDAGPDAAQLDASASLFAELMHPQTQRDGKQQSDGDDSQGKDSSDDDGDSSSDSNATDSTAKDKAKDATTLELSPLLSGLIGSNMPGMNSNALMAGSQPSSYVSVSSSSSTTSSSSSSTTSSSSSSYTSSSSNSTGSSSNSNSYNSQNSYSPNNPTYQPQDSNQNNQNNQNNDDDQNQQGDQDPHLLTKLDPGAQLPSGDQVLQGLQGLTGKNDAIGVTVDAGQVAIPVSELVDRLASRVLVGDGSTGTDPTVRINLRDDVLQGTEITLTRSHGEMVIGFTVSNPELLNQLQKQVDSLQLGLEQRLTEPVRIEIRAKAEAGQVDSGNSGTSGNSGNSGTGDSGDGSSSDGRSRNRQQYQQPDDDNDGNQSNG